jgi:hypothetical protein
MGDRDNDPRWTGFGDVLDALDDWLVDQPDLRLEHLGWLDGGRSGSRIALVIRRVGQESRRVVLRYCADGRPETQRAIEAWDGSPTVFREKHLVRPVDEPFERGSHWWLFQEVAGGDLTKYVPLVKRLNTATFAQDCRAVVAETIRGWNQSDQGAAPAQLARTTAGEYLRELLGSKLKFWLEKAAPDDDTVVRGAELLWNPLLLLKDESPIVVVRGRTHGDLNVRNILVHDDPGPAEAKFKLVDVGGFSADGPLARDAAHLLLSIATVWATSGSGVDLRTLAQAVVPGRRLDPSAGRFRADSTAILDSVTSWIRETFGIGEDWDRQRLLALVAVGLAFATRDVPDKLDGTPVPSDDVDKIKICFFDIAALAATEYMNKWVDRLDPIDRNSLLNDVPSNPLAAQPGQLFEPDEWAALAAGVAHLPNPLAEHEVLRLLWADPHTFSPFPQLPEYTLRAVVTWFAEQFTPPARVPPALALMEYVLAVQPFDQPALRWLVDKKLSERTLIPAEELTRLRERISAPVNDDRSVVALFLTVDDSPDRYFFSTLLYRRGCVLSVKNDHDVVKTGDASAQVRAEAKAIIGRFDRLIRGTDPRRLMFQFVVGYDLLCTDLESIESSAGQPIGMMSPVVLRSLDRMRSGVLEHDWKWRSNLLSRGGHSADTIVFVADDTMPPIRKNRDAAFVVLRGTHAAASRYLRAMVTAGVPAMLWVRGDTDVESLVERVCRAAEDGRLNDIPLDVLELRQDAEDNGGPPVPVCLLWDDINDLPVSSAALAVPSDPGSRT